MFDQKTVDAYKRIKPSDGLRDRVLSAKPETAAKPATILTLKRYASLAACIALVVIIGLAAGRGLSDTPLTVSLADGTALSGEAVSVHPVTTSYTAAARIALHTGDDTVTYPAPASADDCFFLELTSKTTAVVRTEAGSVFMYDEDAGNYLEYTYDAYFEGKAKIYWHIPETEVGESHVLTVADRDSETQITLTKTESGYTLTSHSEDK